MSTAEIPHRTFVLMFDESGDVLVAELAIGEVEFVPEETPDTFRIRIVRIVSAQIAEVELGLAEGTVDRMLKWRGGPDGQVS